MYLINQIGYFPAYGLEHQHRFTKEFPKKVSVTMDSIVMDKSADINILVQCEPPNLYVDFYGMVLTNHQNFDLVLAYDPRILDIPGINAIEFCPIGSWINSNLELDKKNQISYLMSSKINGHDYHMRFMILRWLEKNKLQNFDIFWHRSPPKIPDKNDFFINAKFNVACENQVMDNMFTEKLIDCFKTKTVPIYYGCQNLQKYFNPRGVIAFNTIEQFDEIMRNLTSDVYDDMLPYIEENYVLSKPYWEKNVYQRIEDIVSERFFDVDQTNNFLMNYILD